MLSWQAPKMKEAAETDVPQLLYNVYASREWPVDITDARNLIATRLPDCALALTEKSGQHYYAVTTLDRYGNESEALQSYQPATSNSSHPSSIIPHPSTVSPRLLPCDGQHLLMPERPATMDARMVCIETVQGKLVTTLPYKGKEIRKGNEKFLEADISKIPDGFYQLRSLNRRGITHRLGFFMIKRH